MNFLMLKIYNIKQKELDKLYDIGIERVNNYTYIKFWFNAIASMANLLLIILLIISLAYFGRQVLEGNFALETFFFVFLLIAFARSQFYRFGIFVAELAEKLTSLYRFDTLVEESLLYQKEQNARGTHEKTAHHMLYPITFDGVDFAYGEESQDLLFENFSLTIQPGKSVAIVGRSGSGKSTLFKLLTKMVIPHS
jgi:ATP-binding cassette subfamily B protein